MKRVNVVITAGGTSEKIDEVRKITNMSTGALGKKIAEEITNKHEEKIECVYYLCSKHALYPSHEKIKVIHTESVSELSSLLEQLLLKEKIDYFIHSMAISDYTTNFVSTVEQLSEEITNRAHLEPENLKEIVLDVLKNGSGAKMDNSSKLSSKNDNLIITLKQTEKIISKIKTLSPKTFLVGFKLLNDVTEHTLFDTAFSLLRKNRCNLVLANDLALIKKGEHTGMIVYPEKKYELSYGKENIAKTLVSTMFKRGETRYPSSIPVSSDHNISEKLYQSFYTTGKSLFASGLLPVVESGTYGNMSVKNEESFFITGRNVQKGNLTRDMLVKIEKVEELSPDEDESVFAKVFYKGSVKPSIDTAIHHFIYKNTGHKAIIHVHTDKIFYDLPLSDYNYACGTEEEMKSILEPILKNKEATIIQMNKHGLIVMGETLKECLVKVDTLFKEEVSIDTLCIKKDEHAYSEWLKHYKEVYVEDEKYDLTQVKDYFSVKVGNEVVGVLYKKEKKDTTEFVLYSLEETRGKNLKIGEKVINILKLIAKTKNTPSLTLLTAEKCGVKNYYKKKLGFTQMPSGTEMIIMKLEI